MMLNQDIAFAQDGAETNAGEGFEMPDPTAYWAFVVEGDSMRPRFYPGEVVMFRKEPSPIDSLVGQYCLVQLADSGERMVKTLRRGRTPDRWRLESHNADPIEDVALAAAFRWVATFPPHDSRAGPARETKPARQRQA